MSIPTPPDLAEGRVSWTIGRGSSRALAAGRGVVRFEASAVAVSFSTATVLPDPVETPVLAGIMTPVDLIQNDPEIWNWRVTPMVGVPWEPFPIDVDGPVNLATAAVAPGKGPIRAVKGRRGVGLDGTIENLGGGRFRFRLDDGTLTNEVQMAPGPPGPPNALRIGTVSGGDDAAATITGTAPSQALNLVLPRGEGPETHWDGTRLVVNGETGPDLKGVPGDDSTVPGPPGTTAYEYAVQAGFEGTEAEFAEAVLPETITWQNVDDKPTEYPPLAHQHAWADVIGKPTTFPPTTGTTATTAAPGDHTHAWGAITGKPSTFAPATHTHDDRYYTRTQADAAAPWVTVVTLTTNGGTGSNQSGGSVAVTFPSGRFSTPPAVIVTKQSGGAARAYAYATNITATGCTVSMYDPVQGTAATPVEVPIAVAAYPT